MAARGDEGDVWPQGPSMDVDDGARARCMPQQQPYMRQYDAPRNERYPHQQERRPYDDRDTNSPVNARREQHQQRQEHRHDTRYDDAHRDSYSKEQIEMREVSQYPPAQQYLNPAPHGHYTGGVRSQPPQKTSSMSRSGQGNGPAYAPAPVATASMADLRDSMTNSTITSDGLPAKKPKRVYETAFGSFSWGDLLKRKYWKYYAGLIIIGILVLLAVIFHDDIIKWMRPVAEKIRDIPGGFMIFVGIMFVISFPPLFGQEVLGLFCGLIYGLWWGFAIISLGTMLGEWGNFLVFKYWCSARSAKTEEKDVTYACMCRVIREGGFRIAFMARLSILPGHLTTPAFAACGMSFWIFSITAFLTLPKQLMTVYLGTVFGKEDDNKGITTSKIVEWVVLGVTFLITILALWYIYAKMAKWRPIVMEEQAAKRLAAEQALERNLVAGGLAEDLDQSNKTDIPRVTLSDESGIVKSPSGRSYTRFSMNPWPNHNRQGHKRESDFTKGGSNLRRMEEGSLGDLEGAQSPLVADSAAPAGHAASRQYRQEGLYPASVGMSPYNSSEEDIGYGYADGGDSYSAPHAAGQSYVPDSANVSMKWNPPQLEDGALPPVPTYEQNVRHRDYATDKHGPLQSVQYNPAQYRQQFQSHPETGASAPPAHYQHLGSNDGPSRQTSSLPNSVLPTGSVPAEYRADDQDLQSTQCTSPHVSSLDSALQARQKSPRNPGTYGTPSDSHAAHLPPSARLYPSHQGHMPQAGNSTRLQPQEDRISESREAPRSRYPDMVEPRAGLPISSTRYHTESSKPSATRYRSEPDPNRPSPYHTGPADPDSACRAVQPDRSQKQQQNSRYSPKEGYEPADAQQRY